VTDGPHVVGERAADRLMRSLDYRMPAGVEPLTPEQVAVVLHALADHTALEAARVYLPDSSPWPTSTSIGRWLHDTADQLEGRFS
jgi:hypothetical protein